MSSKINKATIKIRRDASSTWTSTNPTPKQGEWCLAVDTRELKIGDGSTAWNSLGGITLEVNGNVGIGTSSPQKDLHIESGVPTIRMSDENAGTDQLVATLIEFYRGNNTNRVGFLGMESSGNNILKIATDYAAGQVKLATGSNVDALTIDSSQNVGIGTTNPGDKLHVVDTRTDPSSAALWIQHTGANPGGIVYGAVIEKTGASQTNVGGSFSAIGATNNYGLIVPDGNFGIGTTTPTQLLSVNEKSGMTAIGGIAIKLTNKTGSNTVAGQLVQTDTTTNDAFATSAANADDTIGIVVDAGIADGSEAWIIISGIADVLMDSGGSTRGDRIIASTTAGSGLTWNVGGAVATHFQEIGHCIETRVGAGLARCVLHFN